MITYPPSGLEGGGHTVLIIEEGDKTQWLFCLPLQTQTFATQEGEKANLMQGGRC